MEFVSKNQLDEFLQSEPSCSMLTVLNFWASWSEASKQMNEVFEELSKKPDCRNVNFVKIEAEAAPDISLKYGIKAVPTFIFTKGMNQFDRLDGAHAAELTRRVLQYASPVGMPPLLGLQSNGISLSKEELISKLKALTSSARCIVFMKGSSDQPRCGFSKQLCALLNENNVDFKTFDILQDEQVRQGLKEYSNWPTYPQLYVDGELIGGLDIVKELLETKELQSKLPKKMKLEEKLKSLINKAPIMVFMKGNRDTPRCGFSKTLVQILNEANAKYDTFDILEDEEVRQQLKTFSNWPTYPQVYVNGELIGGLDIIEELKETNELTKTLKV